MDLDLGQGCAGLKLPRAKDPLQPLPLGTVVVSAISGLVPHATQLERVRTGSVCTGLIWHSHLQCAGQTLAD